MKTPQGLFSCLTVFSATALPVLADCEAVITSVSVPVDSSDGGTLAQDDDVWSVSAPPYPLDTDVGIGHLLRRPVTLEMGCLADHAYVAPHVPDPLRAMVTYEFDRPVAVDQIEIVQTVDGITRIEGFVGSSIESLQSIGAVFGPHGDVLGNLVFAAGESNVFDFDNAVEGTVFRFVITKSSRSDGWGAYRAFPRTSDGAYVPPAGGWTSWDYHYSFDDVFSTESEATVVLEENAWRNARPCPTYYAPETSGIDARVRRRFQFPEPVVSVFLATSVVSWNHPAAGMGYSSIWASRDGEEWVLVLDNPLPPAFGTGIGRLFQGELPNEVLGGEVWVEARMHRIAGWAGGGAQTARSYCPIGPPVFALRARYEPLDDVVGLYRFEDGMPDTIAAGSLLDSSPSGVLGLPEGAPVFRADTPDTNAPCDQNVLALEFTDNADAVRFDSAFVLHRDFGDATFECLLKVPDQAHSTILWTRPDGLDRNRFHLSTNPGPTLALDYRTPTGSLIELLPADSFSLQADVWTHVAIVRSVDVAGQHVYSFYKDGSLVHTAVDASPDLPQNAQWTVGGRPTPNNTFRGLIDDIRLTGATLEPADFLLPECPPAGEAYCFGDGSGGKCPCGPGQTGAPGSGCLHSFGLGGRLRAYGRSRVSEDTLLLETTDLPISTIGLFFQGGKQENGGDGVPFGDGLRCTGGDVIRLGARVQSGGTSTYGHDSGPSISLRGLVPPEGGTRYYQVWYRNAAPGWCTPERFNLTNGVRIEWMP